jgi:glucokinase
MAARLIGIDIGGTSVRVALFSNAQSDQIDREEQFPASGEYAVDLQKLIETIKTVTEKPEGIGIGIAGEFDQDAGALHHSPHLKGWVDKPLREDLKQAFGCPIVIVNDADAAALAEVTFAEHPVDFWLLTWGTGIGSSVVEIGADGPRVLDAEAGHHVLRWDETSPVCECGKHGCFEAYVGGTSVQKRFGKMITDLDGEQRQEVLDWMARGIYNMIRMFPVEQVVLGGGVAEKLADALPDVEQSANGYLEGFRTITLSLAKHGEQAGMVGAMAALQRQS